MHVDQQRLVERCREAQSFVIWDVGLGAAANAIACIRALENLKTECRIELHSFDKTKSPLEFALNNAEALGYLVGFETRLKELLEKGCIQITPNFSWHLHLADFSKTVKNGNSAERPSPDAIFYDPYSPIGNPDMWSLDHFIHLRARLPEDRMCLLSNYTRSTSVRVSLLLAGFYVGIGCIIHEKDETLVASNFASAIERPLNKGWLEKRVRISKAGAPLRGSQHVQAPISDEDYARLLAHPQFC